MMLHGQGTPDRKLGRGRPAQSSTAVCRDAQVLKAEEKEAAANDSSSSSSSYALMGATAIEKYGYSTASCPQNPQGIFSLPTALGSTPKSQCCEGSSGQGEGAASSAQGGDASQVMQGELLNDKLDKLLPFLLHKYQKKEQVTMEEMLHILGGDYHVHDPLLFKELCECICMNFGIEMREVDAPGHTNELVPILVLTYNGLLDNEVQAIPKVDLLILILSIITAKGSRISEEGLRELLRNRQLLDEREHAVIGDPWKFITDLVQEEYLVYQQVPNSDPARYEFLWGLRAHAETPQMKVLQHIFNCDSSHSRAYGHLHKQAFRKDEVIFRAPEGQDE
ncbi:PREDICTED: melanoma-associated antigen 8-like [Chinchilla lanigera]|uniref:melanoma-associated antigen 8-like n=1 Tax=Chinchilla lanigera TaxID=34839 RepID=UPI00038EBB43|nr:PREDICTED: melanoma-associated antigen 8-like [Chinchilla lanigera]